MLYFIEMIWGISLLALCGFGIFIAVNDKAYNKFGEITGAKRGS